MCIPVASASGAVYALHTLQFDYVIVPEDKANEWEYAALLSTMRLMAPNTRLVCAPPGRPAQEAGRLARIRGREAQETNPVRL